MLTEHRHHFPLGATLTPAELEPKPDGTIAPFGLKYALTPAATVDVDFPAISYDPDRQIAVVTDGDATLPAMRHTSTKTKTATASRDRSGPDEDTDATGD